MSEIEIIQKCLETGVLLSARTFEHLDLEALLSKRDSQEFEAKWLALFNIVEKLTFGEQETATINRIRELAYKSAFNGAADPDLAGYVSDDFELISKGVAAKIQDKFLAGLLESYAESKIPAEADVNSRVDANDIVRALREKLPS